MTLYYHVLKYEHPFLICDYCHDLNFKLLRIDVMKSCAIEKKFNTKINTCVLQFTFFAIDLSHYLKLTAKIINSQNYEIDYGYWI